MPSDETQHDGSGTASAGHRRRTVIIGAGIAGLATAALLAREGDAVTVLETSDTVGGRVGTWQSDGFRFDTGPSWYLMPEVFEHFYRMLGTDVAHELQLVTLDPGYRLYFEPDTAGDSATMDIPAGRERVRALFERTEPGAGARLDAYLDSAADAYRLSLQRFLYTSFESKRELFSRELLIRLPHLSKLLSTSLERYIAASFHDPRLRQVLGYPAVFLGSSPSKTPALYHLMSHLDLDAGVLYPRGGFRLIIDGMERLAREAGVEILTGAHATAILTDPPTTRSGPTKRSARRRHRAAVRGVAYQSGGTDHTVDADVVVSAADLHHTETTLLPPNLQSYPQKWWKHRTPGPGAVLVLLGVQGALPELAHHTLFFTRDWHANFGAIFDAPASIPDPASIYVCRPSATDDSVAPAGEENLFVLVPVPADPTIGHGGVAGTGSELVERTADTAIAQIAIWAGIPDLAERVVVRRTIGPADFADDLNAWGGTALGPAHTLRQSAFLRGSNASRRVAGLYFAGGSTLPGIGLPMCLISAELVVKRLRGDRTAGPLPEPRLEVDIASGLESV
ncbi:phytoene desaturase family protein [Humibacter sp. RRB41]|uniref:phytoene desaturase family protein n=1 Tax=Humibacter sp. RRB41 TaxID=2919946 RepID=UPI001FAA5E2B|nr:phytoene desaturase family protein [Humibacter sp. RRB41]